MRDLAALRQVTEASDLFLNLAGLNPRDARKRVLAAVPQFVDDLELRGQTWIRDPEQFLADRDEQELLADRIKQRLEIVFRALAQQRRRGGEAGEFDPDALDAALVRLTPLKGKSAKGWLLTLTPTFAELEQQWLAPASDERDDEYADEAGVAPRPHRAGYPTQF